MEGRIASDKNKCSVVKLGRAQNSEARPWERGILMSEQEMQEVLDQLTQDEKAVLYELLLALAQNPLPAKSLPASDYSKG